MDALQQRLLRFVRGNSDPGAGTLIMVETSSCPGKWTVLRRETTDNLVTFFGCCDVINLSWLCNLVVSKLLEASQIQILLPWDIQYIPASNGSRNFNYKMKKVFAKFYPNVPKKSPSPHPTKVTFWTSWAYGITRPPLRFEAVWETCPRDVKGCQPWPMPSRWEMEGVAKVEKNMGGLWCCGYTMRYI